MTAPFQVEFVRFAGELAEKFSLNRSIGQIYGLLYFSAEPVSLGEVAKHLKMSKGNVSVNIRMLETWGAVHSVWVSGSRQDHYEANRDLKEIFIKRLREGLGRRLDWADERLKHLRASAATDRGPLGDSGQRKILEEMSSMIHKGRMAIQILPKFFGFPWK